MQRAPIMFLITLGLLIPWLVTNGGLFAKDTPNVILIIIDTLRADHLRCYGYDRNTSPNIDKFAQTAILYKNAISTAPWTSPAIGSIFTAQYPHVLGYDSEPVILEDRFLCVAELFNNHGYNTGGVIAHILVSQQLNFNQGFDLFDEDNARGHAHVSSPSITEKGISFVEKHADEKFFLFLHYFDPHCDYILHTPYDYYPGYDGSLYSGQPIEELRNKAPELSAKDVRYLNALYDSEITFTDKHVGRFLDRLKDLELYDDMLIIIVSDHGEAFLERGDTWIGHTRTVYQELIRVPLIIKMPHQKKGRIADEYVSLIDVMPTVASVVGLEIPEGYQHDGEALPLDGEAEAKRQAIFSETERWGTAQSVIQDGWKLIYDPSRHLRQFFDLKRDPGETKDLSAEQEERVRKMAASLHQWNYDIGKKRLKVRARHPELTPEQREQLKSLGYIQ